MKKRRRSPAKILARYQESNPHGTRTHAPQFYVQYRGFCSCSRMTERTLMFVPPSRGTVEKFVPCLKGRGCRRHETGE